MKRKWIFLVLVFAIGSAPVKVDAQLYEIERLILDIEKLAQLKHILSDLYKGYEILSSGYQTIKDISQGNFNLHKAFLDGLLTVSPAIKKYKRVADIIGDQGRIVSEYKSALNRFTQYGHFNPDELDYLSAVYSNLINKSEKNLENLLNVMTADKLRMSDAERLHAIDGLYADTKDELSFLINFNHSVGILAVQRAAEANDAQTLRGVYGIK